MILAMGGTGSWALEARNLGRLGPQQPRALIYGRGLYELYIYMYKCIYVYMFLFIYAHVYIYICIYVCIYVYIHVRISIYIYILCLMNLTCRMLRALVGC